MPQPSGGGRVRVWRERTHKREPITSLGTGSTQRGGRRRRGPRVYCGAPPIGANPSYEPLESAVPVEPPAIANVSFSRFRLPSLSATRWPLPNLMTKADQTLRFALLFPWLAARLA